MERRKSRSRYMPKRGNENQTAMVSSAPPSTSPPWIELPEEITANILQRLGAQEILESAQKVCTTWRKVCQDHPAMWRVIDLFNSDSLSEKAYCKMCRNAEDRSKRQLADKMCRNAVDRSQGQLVDLSITFFGNDKLMKCIADRSSNLKCLQLISCYDIGGGLAEAAKKLPQLEELHLIIMNNVRSHAVEAIGNSCPKLKSFTYYNNSNASPFHGSALGLPLFSEDDDPIFHYNRNDYARAIAKSMPNLLHLRLWGDELNNRGLKAILDGCPHLESLDLRRCCRLDLGGDLGERCSKQIKVLKRPSDSVLDVWWLTHSSFCSNCLDYEQSDDFASPFGFGYFNHDDVWDDCLRLPTLDGEIMFD